MRGHIVHDDKSYGGPSGDHIACAATLQDPEDGDVFFDITIVEVPGQ